MLEFLLSLLAAVRVFFRSRADTSLEIIALRQQVAVLQRHRPRPTLTRVDRFFWTTVPTEKAVLVAAVDVAADDGYASGR